GIFHLFVKANYITSRKPEYEIKILCQVTHLFFAVYFFDHLPRAKRIRIFNGEVHIPDLTFFGIIHKSSFEARGSFRGKVDAISMEFFTVEIAYEKDLIG